MSKDLQFPKGFIFGTATASYQIEGATNEDGKGVSIWDSFVQKKGKIKDHSNGEIACDHYHRYKDDLAIMKELGLHAYRFSLAWTRILPEGRGSINQKGIDFYKNLIDELLEAGITPFPTLYHWDLPQKLQDKGGWINRDNAKWFADYVNIVTQAFSDNLKNWITLNEPYMFTTLGYAIGMHAPGKKNMLRYLHAVHNVLRGHGLAMQAIRSNVKDANAGITLDLDPIYPESNKPKDLEIVEVADAARNRIFLDPILKGSYPEEVRKRCKWIMPKIHDGDMEQISQPLDFLGINNYSRMKVYFTRKIPFLNYYSKATEIPKKEFKKDGIQYTAMGNEVFPEGLYELLMRIKNDYGNIPVYITENGASYTDVLEDGKVNDPLRIDYIEKYLGQVKRAIDEGSNCKGYFVWTLMDNFEWAEGYTKRFGLTYINFKTQERVIKESGFWYKKLISSQK